MTKLKLDGTFTLWINENIRLDIDDDGIVINDFEQKSNVVVTGGDAMDMIKHEKVHTIHFRTKENRG